MRTKSFFLLLSSVITAICGAVVVGLGVWNGQDIAWTPFPIAIAALGAVIIGVSFLGFLVSRGVTFWCNCGLWTYLTAMSVLVLGQTLFVILVNVEKDEWIRKLAENQAEDGDQEEINRLEKDYDDFWPYVIGFGVLTLASSLVGLFFAFIMKSRLALEREELDRIVSDRRTEQEKAKTEELKKRHKEVVLSITDKYRNMGRPFKKNTK